MTKEITANKNLITIPKSFELIDATIYTQFSPEINKYLNDKDLYGEADYNQQVIKLASTVGVDLLPNFKILETYYHEKIHFILEAMGEKELRNNEKFVDLFARLLLQTDLTSKY